MSIVNWFAAPLGTTAYQPPGPEQHEGWYRKNARDEVMWWPIGREDKKQWTWLGGRCDYPYGAIIRPAEAVTVKIEPGNGALGTVVVDWSKAPEGTMGFHPQANGYVDHWVKWAENGDNWFCTCGFEECGWQNSYVKLSHMLPRYFSTIIVRPQSTEPAAGLHGKMHNAWLEYANNFRESVGVQIVEEATLRGQISMQVFYAGFAAGVKAGQS